MRDQNWFECAYITSLGPKVSKMLGYILGAGKNHVFLYPHHIGLCALVADFSIVDPKISQLILVAPNSTALQCLTNIHSKLYKPKNKVNIRGFAGFQENGEKMLKKKIYRFF